MPESASDSAPPSNVDVAALRRLALPRDADFAHACDMLPRPKRATVLQIFAVFDQLAEVMGANLDTAAPAASDPTATPSCGTHEANAAGCEACGGESISQRRGVCSAILDFLYNGERTGKPELDGFHAIAAQHTLPREAFDRWCDGVADLLATQRIATWARLRALLEPCVSPPVALAALVLRDGNDSDPLERDQQQAWITALVSMRLFAAAPRRSPDCPLWLAMDDLLAVGITERQWRQWCADPATVETTRWARLVDLQADRAEKLYAGGVRWLRHLPPSVARGPAVLGELHRQHWARWQADPPMLWRASPARRSGFWSRLRGTRAAMRTLVSLG